MPYSAKQLHRFRRLRMLQIPRDPVQFSILDQIRAGLVKVKRDAGFPALPCDLPYPVEIQRTGVVAALSSQGYCIQIVYIRCKIHFLQHRFQNDLFPVQFQRQVIRHPLLKTLLILAGAADRQIRIFSDVDQFDPLRSFRDAVKAAVASFPDKAQNVFTPFIRFLKKEIA